MSVSIQCIHCVYFQLGMLKKTTSHLLFRKVFLSCWLGVRFHFNLWYLSISVHKASACYIQHRSSTQWQQYVRAILSLSTQWQQYVTAIPSLSTIQCSIIFIIRDVRKPEIRFRIGLRKTGFRKTEPNRSKKVKTESRVSLAFLKTENQTATIFAMFV